MSQAGPSGGSSPSSPNSGNSNQQISQDTNQLVDKVFGFFSGEKWANALVGLSESDNGVVNPMIAMKSLGDNILVGAETTFVSYVALRGATGLTENANNSIWGNVLNFFSGGMSGGIVGAISQMVEAISPFLVLGIFALFGLGLTLSIYVPFIPFIIWFAAIINWVVFIAIGVVAAPLWAFSHLTGEEGSGMSKTQHGYIFIVNAMLRPVLMVAAFFIAGGLVVMGGTLLNQLFTPAIQNVQSDSITGIVSIIAIITVYVTICLTLLHTSFNLIFQIPDKVMEWIGGSEIATGQGSEQEQRNALQSISNYVRDAGGRQGNGPMNNPSQGSDKNSIQKR